MSWFGWLTKSQLEVTVLDRLILFGELGGVIVIVVTAAVLIQMVQIGLRKKPKRLRR